MKDWDTWFAVASKLPQVKQSRNPVSADEAQESGRPRRRFRTTVIDGYEVMVGRSSKENDELTFRVAAPEDFWLHVSDYTGSHVVVRNPQRRPQLEDSILVKAAQLAAFFSQARNAGKVNVHYTRRKNVSKPKKAAPGQARLSEFKTITVEPRNWLEESS
mgnify:CR=1 FL=1